MSNLKSYAKENLTTITVVIVSILVVIRVIGNIQAGKGKTQKPQETGYQFLKQQESQQQKEAVNNQKQELELQRQFLRAQIDELKRQQDELSRQLKEDHEIMDLKRRMDALALQQDRLNKQLAEADVAAQLWSDKQLARRQRRILSTERKDLKRQIEEFKVRWPTMR
jgi:Tfp pilus assembly protein PilO